jgi:hypothetical protein
MKNQREMKTYKKQLLLAEALLVERRKEQKLKAP